MKPKSFPEPIEKTPQKKPAQGGTFCVWMSVATIITVSAAFSLWSWVNREQSAYNEMLPKWAQVHQECLQRARKGFVGMTEGYSGQRYFLFRKCAAPNGNNVCKEGTSFAEELYTLPEGTITEKAFVAGSVITKSTHKEGLNDEQQSILDDIYRCSTKPQVTGAPVFE